MTIQDRPPETTATRARQGRPGQRVLTILFASLALVAIVWIGVEVWGDASSPDPAPGQISEPSQTQTNQ